MAVPLKKIMPYVIGMKVHINKGIKKPAHNIYSNIKFQS